MTDVAAPTRTPRTPPPAPGPAAGRVPMTGPAFARQQSHPLRSDDEQLPQARRRPQVPHDPRPARRLPLRRGGAPDRPRLAWRFGATVHTVTVAASNGDLRRIRGEAARALGTDPDDPHIHVEVDTDVAGAVQRCAPQLDSCLVCLATHGRGRLSGIVLGSTGRDIVEPAVLLPSSPGPKSSSSTAKTGPPRRRSQWTTSSPASTGRPAPSGACRSPPPGPMPSA